MLGIKSRESYSHDQSKRRAPRVWITNSEKAKSIHARLRPPASPTPHLPDMRMLRLGSRERRCPSFDLNQPRLFCERDLLGPSQPTGSRARIRNVYDKTNHRAVVLWGPVVPQSPYSASAYSIPPTGALAISWPFSTMPIQWQEAGNRSARPI